jgi:hypothetical protein
VRIARRTALTVALVPLLVAAPAAARTAVTPVGISPLAERAAVAGPRLAGDALVWGGPVRDGYEVATRRGGNVAVSKIVVPELARQLKTRISAHLEASSSRLILALRVSGCRGYVNCNRDFRYTTLYDAVLTGPLGGGALTKLTGCTARSACAGESCGSGRVDVSGDVVAYEDCTGTHVRDLAPGASPAGRDYPLLMDPRVAGSYLAAQPDYHTFTVSNWRTGADAYSIGDTYDYDVQPDGKAAFDHGGTAAWASLDEPFAHDVGQYETPVELRFAGDRIAYSLGIGSQGAGYELVDLAGNSISPADDLPDADDSWALDEFHLDFDGSRLAWINRICTHSAVVTWSPDDPVAGDQPPNGGDCPFPRLVPERGWLDRKQRLRVRIACDDEPGCVGIANGFGGRIYGERLDLPYSVQAGHRKTIRLDRVGRLCRTRGGRVRARVAFTVQKAYADWRGDTARGKVDTVFVRGHSHGLPRC